MSRKALSLLLFLVAVASSCPAQVRAVIANCCTGSGTILEIESATFATERTISTGAIATGTFSIGESFALTPDGHSAAVLSTGGPGGVLTLVNLVNGTASAPVALPFSYDGSCPIAVNPASGAIYTSYVDADNDAHVLEADAATLTFVADVNIGVYECAGIVVSPDGKTLYIEPEIQPTGPVTAVLRASDLSTVGTFACAGPIAVSPDSRTVYAAGCGAIDVIDAATLQVQHSVPFPQGDGAGALATDGSAFYLTGDDSNQICTFSTSTLALSCVATQFPSYQVTASPNGTVYIGGNPSLRGSEGRVAVFDPVTQTITANHQLPTEGMLLAGPGGKQLYFLNGQSSQISSTAAVPYAQVLQSATIGANPGAGAYDAPDDLVIFENATGGVEVYNATTLQSRGLISFPGSGEFVGYNGSGFYVSSTRSATIGPRAGVISVRSRLARHHRQCRNPLRRHRLHWL